MRAKKLLSKLKKLSYNQILAVIFLAVIFYIGAAGFPSTVISVVNFFKNSRADIIANMRDVRSQIDGSYKDMLGFEGLLLQNKGMYINLNGFMARVMGQRHMNTIVKLSNGHLSYTYDALDISRDLDQITKLYNKQTEAGKAFLFVLAPAQLSKFEDMLPTGYENYENINADNLIKELKANGVPTLDLRDELASSGIKHSDAFFITDHHWTPQTGFWAYTKIVDYLTSKGLLSPIEPMYTDINAYNIDIHKNWFLGVSGKRTGIYFAGIDDFPIIFPKFDTDISLEIPSISFSKKGRFEEVVYSGDENKLDYFVGSPYWGYGHSNRDIKYYRNENAAEKIKVMGIGDSFTHVTFTFLPLIVSSFDQLDMREYRGNFEEYYSEYEPDIVIILINPSEVSKRNTTYDFFGDFQE